MVITFDPVGVVPGIFACLKNINFFRDLIFVIEPNYPIIISEQATK